MGKTFSFVSGALFGAAAGAIIGVALAPRSGAETRAMAADIANDAWDNMRDTYEHGAEEARAAVNDFGPMVDAKTDDLRAKVDLARERMDQLREQLNDAISGGKVTPAADVVVENVTEPTPRPRSPRPRHNARRGFCRVKVYRKPAEDKRTKRTARRAAPKSSARFTFRSLPRAVRAWWALWFASPISRA